MRVIHKSRPLVLGLNVIETPSDAIFLHANTQQGLDTGSRTGMYVWYRCDPSKPMVKRHLVLLGTGQMLPDDFEYIGTIHQFSYVWHLGEVREL